MHLGSFAALQTGGNTQELCGYLNSRGYHRNLPIYQLCELGKISALKPQFLLVCVCVCGGLTLMSNLCYFSLMEGSGLSFSCLEKPMLAEV